MQVNLMYQMMMIHKESTLVIDLGLIFKSFLLVVGQINIYITIWSCWMRRGIALSGSTDWASPATDIATAAAISDGLNSKKSIPAFIFSNHPIQYQSTPFWNLDTTMYRTRDVMKKFIDW